MLQNKNKNRFLKTVVEMTGDIAQVAFVGNTYVLVYKSDFLSFSLTIIAWTAN